MKIRMKRYHAGLAAEVGDVIDVPTVMGQRLIHSDNAEAVDECGETPPPGGDSEGQGADRPTGPVG